ncbi:hypothetical protein U1Q18_027969 [Sarracenia purpurea var. burkii]
MPDLGNLLNSSSSLTLSRCPSLKPVAGQSDSCGSLYPKSVKSLGREGHWCSNLSPLPIEHKENVCTENGIKVFRRTRRLVERGKKAVETKSLDAYVKAWIAKKVESGVPERKCFLPFLVGAPRLVECSICQNLTYPGEEVLCSVRGCQAVFHSTCAKERIGLPSLKKIKCLQHACFLCKQKPYWRCVRCMLASHNKCDAFPEGVIHLRNQPGRAVCWRHPADWRLEKKRRNDVDADVGCTNCISTECSDDCVCRVQCISCSKACRCSDMCTNRPFRKEKKVKIVKTEFCGWGVEAAESINKGEFVIEYIGEGSFLYLLLQDASKHNPNLLPFYSQASPWLSGIAFE